MPPLFFDLLWIHFFPVYITCCFIARFTQSQKTSSCPGIPSPAAYGQRPRLVCSLRYVICSNRDRQLLKWFHTGIASALIVFRLSCRHAVLSLNNSTKGSFFENILYRLLRWQLYVLQKESMNHFGETIQAFPHIFLHFFEPTVLNWVHHVERETIQENMTKMEKVMDGKMIKHALVELVKWM